MKQSTKDMILIGSALLGAYAAWLQIKKDNQENAVFSDWFSQGAFNHGSFDFYSTPKSYDWTAGNDGSWPGI